MFCVTILYKYHALRPGSVDTDSLHCPVWTDLEVGDGTAGGLAAAGVGTPGDRLLPGDIAEGDLLNHIKYMYFSGETTLLSVASVALSVDRSYHSPNIID